MRPSRLSSYATCALLHLECCLRDHPARAHPGAAVLGALGAQAAADLGALLEEVWPFGGPPGGFGAQSGPFGGQSGAPGAWRPGASYPDGVQLLVPRDPHHWAVVREPAGPAAVAGRLLESLTAAASAALASATEDLGGQPGLGGGGGSGATGAAPAARAEGAGGAGTRGEAGLRAATAALRAEDLFWDSGLATVPACARGAGGGGLPPLLSGDAVPGGPAAAGPPPVIGPEWDAAAPPDFDVVFVHGVRGGPFVTWRRGDVLAIGAARASLTHADCWPSAWMAGDLPGARLLSIEYHVSRAGYADHHACWACMAYVRRDRTRWRSVRLRLPRQPRRRDAAAPGCGRRLAAPRHALPGALGFRV
jgi:hypothetical protein